MNSPTGKQKEYIDYFSTHTEELSQFDYLITKALSFHDEGTEGLHQTENLITGCLSKTWVMVSINGLGNLHIEVDSNSVILKGLLIIIQDIYANSIPSEALQLDFRLLDYVKVTDLLTERRKNSVNELITLINKTANTAIKEGENT
jgi:sulfur transfer protein SufE